MLKLVEKIYCIKIIVVMIFIINGCAEKRKANPEKEVNNISQVDFSFMAYSLTEEASFNINQSYSGTYVHFLTIFNNSDSDIYVRSVYSGLVVDKLAFYHNNNWSNDIIIDNFKIPKFTKIDQNQSQTFVIEDFPLIDSIKLDVPIYFSQDTSKLKKVISLKFVKINNKSRVPIYDVVQYRRTNISYK
jgi:hypothetical protein